METKAEKETNKKKKCIIHISNMVRRGGSKVTAKRSGEARGVMKGHTRQGEAG